MANPEHVAKLKEGMKAWNIWRGGGDRGNIDLAGADLSGVNFTEANLIEANLSGAVLGKANLTNADLTGARLTAAKLTRADLSGAFLTRADLTDADLTHVNLNVADLNQATLIGTTLSQAKFTRTDLLEANLTQATLGWTIFAEINLAKTKGLEVCNHLAPSTIGIDTFFQSQGNIPEAFLRGCGVPEQFITYARSLVAEAIQFYSCFISYSSQDQSFAERLNADLRAKNLRCWFAPEDLKIGDRFQESIEESIRLFDKVMIVLSENSMKSRWVEREVNAAREREDRENRIVLFPIRIDDAVMDATQPWAADIRRSRHIGDFSGWKEHDAYQKAFERLLRDLEANEAKSQKAQRRREC
jgi:hypothetical protein